MDLCVGVVVGGEVDGVEVVCVSDIVLLIEHRHVLLVCGGLCPRASEIQAVEVRRARP